MTKFTMQSHPCRTLKNRKEQSVYTMHVTDLLEIDREIEIKLKLQKTNSICIELLSSSFGSHQKPCGSFFFFFCHILRIGPERIHGLKSTFISDSYKTSSSSTIL